MRIAVNGYFWDRPRTGSGQYLRHLWGAMSELVASQGDADSLQLLLPPAQLKTEGSKLKAQTGKMLWESRGVMAEAKRQGAQLLHVPYLSAPLVKIMPVVVTAHDMIPWVVPDYQGLAVVRLYLAVAAFSVKRANVVIADSDASRRDVIKVLKVNPAKVHTVYLGVEPHPDYTQKQLDEVRARLGLPAHFAFYLGGFDQRKNVPLLLRAWHGVINSPTMQACSESKPVLAIGGAVPQPGGIFPNVRGEASRLGLLDGERGPVRFLGSISEEDKPLLMAAARMFVYPSAYEGFGLDPLEAMSVGTIVVSSSGGSLSEVVGDSGLLVPPGDEAALHDAIIRAWTDDELRAALSARAKSRSRQFTWQRTAEQTLQIMHELLVASC